MPYWLFFPSGGTLDSLYGILFDGSFTFDGYTYESGTEYSCLLVVLDPSESISKKFLCRPQSTGYVAIASAAIDNSGNVYASYSVGQNGGVGDQTFIVENSDGTVGATITCEFIGTSPSRNGIVVKWNSSGNVEWSTAAFSNSSAGAGTGQLTDFLTLDLTAGGNLYLQARCGFNSQTSSTHVWNIFPEIHGTSQQVNSAQNDVIGIQLVADSSNGNILSKKVMGVIDGSASAYFVSRVGSSPRSKIFDDGYLPFTALIGSTSSPRYFYWGQTSPSARVQNVSGAGRDIFGIGVADSSGNVGYFQALVTGEISSHAQRYTIPGAAHTFSDNSGLFIANGSYNSFTGQGWWLERISTDSGAGSRIFTDLDNGRGGNIGGYTSMFTRLAYNDVSPREPTVLWSMCYGPGPTVSSTTIGTNSHVQSVINEIDGYIYSMFNSQSQEFWNGSAYINAVPAYGLSYKSIVIMSSFENSGANSWYQLIQSNVSITARGIFYTNKRDFVYVFIDWKDRVLFADGEPEELTLEDLGTVNCGYAKYDISSGTFAGYTAIGSRPSSSYVVVTAPRNIIF